MKRQQQQRAFSFIFSSNGLAYFHKLRGGKNKETYLKLSKII